MHIAPFKISVSDAEIDDLRGRLPDSRWAFTTPSEPCNRAQTPHGCGTW
jgi:hypothetical protein